VKEEELLQALIEELSMSLMVLLWILNKADGIVGRLFYQCLLRRDKHQTLVEKHH